MCVRSPLPLDVHLTPLISIQEEYQQEEAEEQRLLQKLQVSVLRSVDPTPQSITG